MCRFCVNSALKSRHNHRVEFRASCKVMTCYFSCALTELISSYTPLEIRLEQFQYQQSFSPAPTAAYFDPDCGIRIIWTRLGSAAKDIHLPLSERKLRPRRH